MVPRAVLMKSGLVSVNTARQVNVAHSKTTMNAARPMSYLSKTTHSTVKRPIHKNTTFKNNYKEIDGGCVAFGGNPKGGKIIGKGTKASDNAGKVKKSVRLIMEKLFGMELELILMTQS
ncbi:hypothetical protein Tco_1331453 [Tanacetum coccineum]